MPDYVATTFDICIFDSYKVSKFKFRKILKQIINDNPNCIVPRERCMFSMTMEWATHNFLYNIGYERERTRDVDINVPVAWYYQAAYIACGVLSWLFIK